MANPKKSKAFIITLIVVLLLLFVGFFLYKNSGKVFEPGNLSFGKFFEPLFGTGGKKTNLPTTPTVTENPYANNQNSNIRMAQAGEDIVKGGPVYIRGVNENNEPIIYNYTSDLADFDIFPFGRASGDMFTGEIGEIVRDFIDSNGSFDSINSDSTDSFAVCNDGIDNDLDGKTDAADPECHTDGDVNNEDSYKSNHSSETSRPISYLPACSNGLDDDKDGKIDAADPECHTDGDVNNEDSYKKDHYSEKSSAISYSAQCDDGKDNDKDGKIDAADPECHTDGDVNNEDSYKPKHFSEKIEAFSYSAQCSDEKDNDKDNFIDAEDPSCHTDFDATNENTYNPLISWEGRNKLSPQCSDGRDNDRDGFIDAEDPQCYTNENIDDANAYDPEINNERGSIPTPDPDGNGDGDGNGTTDVPDPTPRKTQCNNGLDDDSDGSIDRDDSSCHTDYDENNFYSYDNTLDDESRVKTEDTEENKCRVVDENPLEFTNAEKSKLEELLRKFYLIAPTLKTEDDIILAYNEIERYQNFVSQIDELTKMCNEQKSDSSYTGPQTVYGNPWYKYNDRGTYLDPFGTNTPTQRQTQEPTPERVSQVRYNQLTVTYDKTPRMMFYEGYTMQHIDDLGIWRTDFSPYSGGAASGGAVPQSTALLYCKKYYKNTISVEEYKSETINSWYKLGMAEQTYTLTTKSYKCVIPEGEDTEYYMLALLRNDKTYYSYTTPTPTPAPEPVHVPLPILEEYERLLNVW